MHVVIVGNSAAGLSALESFRRHDTSARVTIVSAETGRPYSRVILPYALRGRVAREGLFIRPEGYYVGLEADTVLGATVDRVDVSERRLQLADGGTLAFDRLLLAPGSRPFAPPIEGLAGPGVHGFWTLEDMIRLDEVLRPGVRLVVLGAGFIALQAAWAAHCRGATVSVVELEGRVLPRVLDEEAAALLTERIRCAGVQVVTEMCIAGVERSCHALCCTASGAERYEADAVVVATGVRPNDHLLPEAVTGDGPGLAVGSSMETAVHGVFAAGDVARASDCGGTTGVLALWPVAVAQGRVAGANLAGAGLTYEAGLSATVTEMFGVTVASVGRSEVAPGDHSIVLRDLTGIDYLKLVMNGDVPVGAVFLGGTNEVRLLGRLAAHVRAGRPLDDLSAFLAGPPLLALAAPVLGGARRSRPDRQDLAGIQRYVVAGKG